MGWIKRLIDRKHYKKNLAEAKALKFFEQNTKNKNLTVEDSLYNIKRSLIEIRHYGSHSSNGILVTTSGYFVTAKHCVTDLKNLSIQDAERNIHQIDRVCFFKRDEDLALVKAKIDVEPEPMAYNIFPDHMFDYHSVIALLRRNEGRVERRFGFIIRNFDYNRTIWHDGEKRRFTKHFETNYRSSPGWSGGTLVDPQGKVLGIHCSSNREFSSGSAARFNSALDLIKHEREKLLANY